MDASFILAIAPTTKNGFQKIARILFVLKNTSVISQRAMDHVLRTPYTQNIRILSSPISIPNQYSNAYKNNIISQLDLQSATLGSQRCLLGHGFKIISNYKPLQRVCFKSQTQNQGNSTSKTIRTSLYKREHNILMLKPYLAILAFLQKYIAQDHGLSFKSGLICLKKFQAQTYRTYIALLHFSDTRTKRST